MSCNTRLLIFQGNIALTTDHFDIALNAFRKAQNLKPDLRSYQGYFLDVFTSTQKNLNKVDDWKVAAGLVQALLKIPKHKEALFAARDAMKAMSNSAKALTLVGDVYAHITDGREKVMTSYNPYVYIPKLFLFSLLIMLNFSFRWMTKQARKFYESALRLEPGYLGAVVDLADLHVLEGRNGEAIALLQKYLKNWSDDTLHTKIAQILAATGKVHESLSHYQEALRWFLFGNVPIPLFMNIM